MSESHVVALSGGKDSTALALRLLELEPRDYTYLCTPTGNESPAMVAHWARLEDLLGQEILRLQTTTLGELIDRQRALPNHRQRWCTRILKIEPYERVLVVLAAKGQVTSYVGLRADEPARPGGIYAEIPGIVSRYPLRDWGWKLADVQRYLAERGVCVPSRTDCEWCFFQRLGEWFNLWRDRPESYAAAEAKEAETGHTFRTPGRDSWPAALAELRREFERGRIPKGWGQGDLLAAAQCRACSL